MQKKLLFKEFIIALTAICCISLHICNASQIRSTIKGNSDQISSILQKNNVNGIVLAGNLNDSPLVFRSRADDINGRNKITKSSLFPIASLQKVYTGIIIQKFINNGIISLNTKLSNFYPSIPNASRITVGDLLTHRSGIMDRSQGPLNMLDNQNAQLQFVQHNLESTGKIGVWNYSNSDYALLAGIISQITGQNYEHYLSTHIFEPNDLNQIKFYNQVRNSSQIVNTGGKLAPHLRFQELKAGMSGELGAGEVFCSAQDYWKFVSELVNDKYVPFSSIISSPYNYYAGVYLDKNFIHADGSINGYQSCFFVNYHTNQAIVFFANNISFEKMLSIRQQIVDAWFFNTK